MAQHIAYINEANVVINVTTWPDATEPTDGGILCSFDVAIGWTFEFGAFVPPSAIYETSGSADGTSTASGVATTIVVNHKANLIAAIDAATTWVELQTALSDGLALALPDI